MLSFGYPEEPETLTWTKRAGGRKPLEAVVHYERW
jgi:nitroreductase